MIFTNKVLNNKMDISQNNVGFVWYIICHEGFNNERHVWFLLDTQMYPQMCDYSLIFNQLINMTYAYYFSIKWYI